jgi:protoheme IX farnesyltransferase
MKTLFRKLHLYFPLIKSLQTGLLLTTGLAGYMSAKCPLTNWTTLLSLTGSLFLAISGSTVLNMWYDRDIDRKMKRTCKRPLASGEISQSEALGLGLLLSVLGVGWALMIQPLYGLIIFAGLFFDVIIYTVWLKRRTCWSIIWGGLSGGMPILAGRALGVGSIDWIGIMLALSVLFWIPTHIMTFSLKYRTDYAVAGIPTFPSTYGAQFTRVTIVASSILAALSIGLAAYGVGMTWGYLRMLIVLSAGLLILATGSIIRPSERANFGLFKYASLYMLSSMLLIVMYGL